MKKIVTIVWILNNLRNILRYVRNFPKKKKNYNYNFQIQVLKIKIINDT